MDTKSIDVQLWNNLRSNFAASRMQMLSSGQLTIKNRTMKFIYKTKGQMPAKGYTLIFGFHGGGGCPAQTNNQQHNNHKALYDNELPNGTIWFTPRAIEDAWDMWFKDYMQDFILQIIRAFALNNLIDINKVFITGYSAGGDGVYHLAPRMADHLAGAAMMAGHPNGINFMNIRNIGFSIQVGEKDGAYNRKNQAVKYIRMLSQLQQNYGGFENVCVIQPNKPHWMDRQDAKVFDWLFKFVRDPYPQVIIFKQCPRRRQTTFYYLRIGEPKNKNREQQTIVMKQGNTFNITSNRQITVLVNSKMINPAMPVTIIHNNKTTMERMLQPRRQVAEKTLLERIDPYYIFEDQFVSEPPSVIDVKSAMCEIFSISKEEKDAQYEKGLPQELDKMPANFSQSLVALVKRNRPLTIGKGRGRGQGVQIGGQGVQIGGQGVQIGGQSLQIGGQGLQIGGFGNQNGVQIGGGPIKISPRSAIQLSQQQNNPTINQNNQVAWQKWQEQNTNLNQQSNPWTIPSQGAWQNQPGFQGQGAWQGQGQGAWQGQGQGAWQGQAQGGWQGQAQGGWQVQGAQGGQVGWQNQVQGGWPNQDQKNWQNQVFQQWKGQSSQNKGQFTLF